MKTNIIYYLLMIISFSGITFLHAQDAILTSGGNATGTGGSASYSIGQLLTGTSFGSNGSVAPGVQQPYEITILTGIDSAEGINLELTVFPNPATDVITLKSKQFLNSEMSYQIFSMDGKRIARKDIENYEIMIRMEHYLPGTYLISLNEKEKTIKTIKIIKN